MANARRWVSAGGECGQVLSESLLESMDDLVGRGTRGLVHGKEATQDRGTGHKVGEGVKEGGVGEGVSTRRHVNDVHSSYALNTKILSLVKRSLDFLTARCFFVDELSWLPKCSDFRKIGIRDCCSKLFFFFFGGV